LFSDLSRLFSPFFYRFSCDEIRKKDIVYSFSLGFILWLENFF